MDKKKKVQKFLNSDRNDYTTFLNKELPDSQPSSKQTKDNVELKNKIEQQKEDMNQDKWWMPAGIYGKVVDQPPYQELDFEKFSFSLLKHYADNEDIEQVIEVLEEFEDNHRRKKLRIQLFEALRKIDSPFFDIKLYYKIRAKMIEANNLVEEKVNEHGYKVLTKGLDSHSFIAPDEEAEKIMREVNNKLEVTNVTRESYRSAISFYNVAVFQDHNEEWFMVKTGGTDYDKIKEKVVEELKDLNFREAQNHIVEGKQKLLNEGDLKEENIKRNTQNYMALLREIQYSENYRESEEDIQAKLEKYHKEDK